MPRFTFRCIECSTSYGGDARRLVCDTCARAQTPGGPTRGILEVRLASLPRAWPNARASSPAFLRAFLPVDPALLAPLAVGATPLVAPETLRRDLGMPRLWLKDDRRNPSGSTKDRASLLVAAKAREYGHHTVATASTGNAAIALAAIAGASALRAVVFVPAAAPAAKIDLLVRYGAHVLPVEGSYDDAFELCLLACHRFGWYNRNTALNPFTIEGKKTAALEIARSLAPDVPDAVLVPTGDGVILSGIAKGFADLRRYGLTEREPRLIAVQPEGASAIARAVASGAAEVVPVRDAASVADSLVVQAPRGAVPCLRAIRATGGGAVTVSEEAIGDAVETLARRAGILAEPSAAAAFAGLLASLEQRLVDPGERVVVMVTGNARDGSGAAGRSGPEPIAPTLDAVAERVGETADAASTE